jgi:hypothetical protein
MHIARIAHGTQGGGHTKQATRQVKHHVAASGGPVRWSRRCHHGVPQGAAADGRERLHHAGRAVALQLTPLLAVATVVGVLPARGPAFTRGVGLPVPPGINRGSTGTRVQCPVG